MSGLRSRAKGVRAERECADLWVASGWTARGLEGSGDWLMSHGERFKGRIDNENAPGRIVDPVWLGPARTIHLEVKRQERLRMAWIDQAKAEAPEGVPPVVCWRPNRGEWIAMLPLTDLLELIG